MQAYGAMWSILAVGLSWFCFKRMGLLAGILGLTLFSTHYIFIQFGRLSLLETAGYFFTMLVLLTLTKSLTKKTAFFCGAFAFLTFTVKATLCYTVPASGLAVILALAQKYLNGEKLKPLLAIFIHYLLGLGIVFLIWLFLFRIPNHEEISRVGAIWWNSVSPRNVSSAINYLINDQIFQRLDRHDFASIVALIFAGVTTYRLLTDLRKVHPLHLALLLCIIGGCLMVGILRYKPTRFSTPIIPVLLGFSAVGLAEFYKFGRVQANFKNNWAANLCGVLSLTAIFRMVFFLYEKPRTILETAKLSIFPGQLSSLFACGIFAIATWFACRLVLKLTLKENLSLPNWLKGLIVFVFVSHFLYGNLGAWAHWWNNRNHTILNASNQIKDMPFMVIGGIGANALAMETKHRAIRVEKGWHNAPGKRIFTDLGLTHLLTTDFGNNQFEYLVDYYSIMKKLKRIKKFKICGEYFYLFEIPEEVKNG